MERVTKYAIAIKELLHEMSQNTSEDTENVHKEVVCDEVNHHYFIIWVGFKRNGGFEDSIMIHFRIKPDGKVWLLANWTEEDLAEALVKKGIPSHDIVLGFHPREVRQHTGYAVA